MIPAVDWSYAIPAAIKDGVNGLIAGGMFVVPILSTYTPSSLLNWSSLTLGTGSLAAIAAEASNMKVGTDPVSGQGKLYVNPPTGGWKWTYDAVTPAQPVTVYGFALTDDPANQILYAVTPRLDTPILMTVPSLLVFDEMSGLVSINVVE